MTSLVLKIRAKVIEETLSIVKVSFRFIEKKESLVGKDPPKIT
jgi:hypothetical protein